MYKESFGDGNFLSVIITREFNEYRRLMSWDRGVYRYTWEMVLYEKINAWYFLEEYLNSVSFNDNDVYQSDADVFESWCGYMIDSNPRDHQKSSDARDRVIYQTAHIIKISPEYIRQDNLISTVYKLFSHNTLTRTYTSAQQTFKTTTRLITHIPADICNLSESVCLSTCLSLQ